MSAATPPETSNLSGVGCSSVTVAATSIALQWAVLKAIDVFKKAKDAHEQEAARKEVEEALDALRKARRAAGLPDK